MNNVAFPLANELAFATNFGLAQNLAFEDALKKYSSVPEVQAAQDMLPLLRAMNLAIEVGSALDYTLASITTNQQLRKFIRDSVFFLGVTGTGGVGGGAAQRAPTLFADRVLRQLQSLDTIKRAGVPELLYGDGHVMTRADFPEILPDLPVAIGRAAPAALQPYAGTIGRSEVQNIDLLEDIEIAEEAGADPKKIRVNQTQVIEDLRAGTNRPDLYFELNGNRIHIEYDRFPMDRAIEHARRILTNDPDAIVILKGVDY